MSAYNPPIENVPIFDTILFRSVNDDNLTIAEADRRYLRFPLAQGAETLLKTTINGDLTLNQDRIHLGNLTQITTPPTRGVAIGYECGNTNQGLDTIAIGYSAGYSNQGEDSVAIGTNSGQITQGLSSVAVGNSCGASTQGATAVAIGHYAGHISQGASAIAIGNDAGYTSQGASAIAIGLNAGENLQIQDAIAIGVEAAQGDGTTDFQQKRYGVAIGHQAGRYGQQTEAVAVGRSAGMGDLTLVNRQGASAVAVGPISGCYRQGASAVAVGSGAGFNNQGSSAVAIGDGAGNQNQGASSIAIGDLAASSNQAANCIQINATGATFAQATASSCIIAPIRTAVPPIPTGLTGNDFYVFYNDTTKELYKTSFAFSPSVTGTNLGLTGTFQGSIRSISSLPVGIWLVSWSVNNTNLVNLTTFSIQIQLGTIAPSAFAGVPNNPAAFTAVIPATTFSASVPWAQQALGILQNSSASNNLYLCGRAVATGGTLNAVDFSLRAERLR